MRILSARLVLFLFLLALCAACARQRAGSAEPPRHLAQNLRVAVAPFSQPLHPGQLIAGHIPEPQGRISPEELQALDSELRDILNSDTRRRYVFIPARNDVADFTSGHSTGQPSALPRWIAYGRGHGLGLLLVPQVLDWHQRQGSRAGVTSPAHVRIEFFLISVAQEALVGRSVFEERQEGLVDNLLNVGSFLKRRGAWISADDMARESMAGAVRELGL